jgi:hypothetical protein
VSGFFPFYCLVARDSRDLRPWAADLSSRLPSPFPIGPRVALRFLGLISSLAASSLPGICPPVLPPTTPDCPLLWLPPLALGFSLTESSQPLILRCCPILQLRDASSVRRQTLEILTTSPDSLSKTFNF